MENQLTNNENALRLFFTEEVFLVEDKSVQIASDGVAKPIVVSDTAPANELPEAFEKEQIAPVEANVLYKDLKEYSRSTDIPQIVEEPVMPKSFKYLGGNKKSVLILVHDKLNEVSTEQGRELLRKIVKAIELGTPDFALVNYANYFGTAYVELHQFFKPKVMLSFGVETHHLGLSLSWQDEIILHETTKLIFAPNLHDLDGDQGAKKSLWGHLQKLK